MKYAEKYPDDKRAYIFSRKEKLYFAGKNIAVILLGFISIYFALFFAIYSLICASVYFKNIGERNEDKKLKNLGSLMYGLAPAVLLITFFILEGMFTVIPLLLGIIFWLYRGQKYGNYSLKELFERYDKRIMRSIPTSVQIGIIAFLIIPPIVLFTGLNLLDLYFFEELSLYMDYLFNIVSMILLNLVIISVATFLYIYAYNLNYIKLAQRDENNVVFSKNQKCYISIKFSLIVLLSVLFIYLSVMFSVYLLLIAALIFDELGKKQNDKKYLILSYISYALIPTIIILATIFYFNYFGIFFIPIFAGLGLLIYVYNGRRYGRFSLKRFQERFEQRFRSVPSVLKYFLIIFLIVMPLVILIGTATFGTLKKETFMIKMRDETKLATDVHYSPLAWDYLQNKPKPAPVILVRTPYGKDGFSGMFKILYAPQKYHVVVQDFRGTHDSEGEKDFMLFTKAYTDGVDTIEWIMDQDWSNGKIGSAGISALAINQYFFAGMADAYDGDDGLRCQSLWFGCPDLYLDAIMEGAYHESSVETWVHGAAPVNWRYQIDKIYDLINSQDLDSILYRSTTLDKGPNTFANVSARCLHVGGWYDHFLQGTIRGYMGYDDRGAKRARGHQKMIIGPWTHGAVYGGKQGELIYPASANGLPLILKWETEIFDESLLGIENDDIWKGDRVAYYLIGDVDDPTVDANKWKYTDDWPLDYDWNRWYMGKDADGNFVLVDNGNELVAKNLTYKYDPRNPVITRGGNNQPGFDTAGPMDQRRVEEEDGELRDDILLFISDKLKKPYTIEGDLKVELCIKTTVNDTDFMVKLEDVYPDGRRMLIIDGALSTRYYKNLTSWNFIDPNTEYRITISLFAIAYQFNVGHRIAVTITSSNYDRYAINPNTAGNITDHFAESIVADNTIITGPGKSRIFFPELNN